MKGMLSRDPSPWSPLDEAFLNQIRLDHALQCVTFLPDCRGEGINTNRATTKLADKSIEELSVQSIEAILIHPKPLKRVACQIDFD